MALTGVQIFKLLPKTNCKKCGHPTCLAYAMKLAARQAKIEDCPDMSEDAKSQLGEASAPPIRPITLGAGAKAAKMGEETVLFRHEKKFVNPCAIAVRLKDTASESDAASLIDAVLKSEMNRVGQLLRVDAILVSNDSGDKGKLDAMAKLVASKAPDTAVIISTANADAAAAALANFKDKHPMLHGANAGNLEAMCKTAKAAGASIAITSATIEEMSDLTEKAKGFGIEDIVLDPASKTAKQIIDNNTMVRRSALKKSFKPLGYPVMTFAERQDTMFETLIASLAIAKYASIVVVSSVEKWKTLAMFALRQNLYTDPQVPMQVEQKIYNIGEVKPESPLIITTNFSLTYFIVSGEVENSKIPTRLAVMDCEGLSVLTAWAAGKFTAAKISQFIIDSGIEKELKNKELIIPGYVAILSGAIEERLPGWKITVGPREANAIPAYLKSRQTA